jgi:hypothetical protein
VTRFVPHVHQPTRQTGLIYSKPCYTTSYTAFLKRVGNTVHETDEQHAKT